MVVIVRSDDEIDVKSDNEGMSAMYESSGFKDF